MKYTRYFSLILAFVLVLTCLNLQVFADENTPQSPNATVTGCHGLDASSPYLGSGEITDNVGAAVLYEINSDTLMYVSNPDVKMYPSSLVKILTALIAVEKGSLQDVVTVSQDVLDTVPYYAASAKLVAGEQITLSDLVYCMMVGSANDAAAVIATHISGSQDAFVNEMNAYATALGCNGTQFVNVHGLHDDAQYTTARDMGRIVTEAVKNEAFLPYFTTVHYTVPATNMSDARDLSSGNFLMNNDSMQIYYDPRVLGGRTGTTEDGMRCLASLSENESMRLVCIVMGSESTYDDSGNTLTYGSFVETSALLNAGFNGYQVVQVLYENQILKQYQVLQGANDVVIGSTSSAYSVLPAGVSVHDLSYKYTVDGSSFNAPIISGQVLSGVQVWYGGLCIAQADLVAMNSVKLVSEPNNPIEKKNEQSSDGITILVIVLIVAGAILVLMAVKFSKKIRIFISQKRSNQHRRDRRRSR